MDPRKLTPDELHTARRAQGDSLMQLKNCDAVVYLNRNAAGKPTARGFVGKALKPAFYYSFRDIPQMMKHIAEFQSQQAEIVASKAARASERKAFRHSLQVGDVLVCSWGYDQTNIDYYQVTELHGAHFVSVREIKANCSDAGNMTGTSTPRVNDFLPGVMRCRVNAQNSIKIKSYAYARPLAYTLVDGERVYQRSNWTAYA